MSSSSILFITTSLLIIVSGFAWVMLRRYSLCLSRIDKELRVINVQLSEMPKEYSIKDIMFAQDQRLRNIGEKLDKHTDNDVLQQHIQDQANQIIAVISTHDDTGNKGVTKADLDVSLQMTNALLEKVLWSLRFDEDKYVEDVAINTDSPDEQGNKNINIETKCAKIGKDKDTHISMKSILEDSNDSYGAILKYMQQSGKSGTEALKALEASKVVHNR